MAQGSTTHAATKVQRWRDLPITQVLGGKMDRAGFRSDNCLLTFNWIQPGMGRWKPHSHPFDQIVLTLAGTQILEIEGEAFKCPAGSIVRVPGNAVHTGWPDGDEPERLIKETRCRRQRRKILGPTAYRPSR